MGWYILGEYLCLCQHALKVLGVPSLTAAWYSCNANVLSSPSLGKVLNLNTERERYKLTNAQIDLKTKTRSTLSAVRSLLYLLFLSSHSSLQRLLCLFLQLLGIGSKSCHFLASKWKNRCIFLKKLRKI